MRIQRFIQQISALFQSRSGKPAGRLRLQKLEERRVLNATLGLAGIDLSGGETLTISDGGMVDVGNGQVQTVTLLLQDGQWTSIDAEISSDLYNLHGSGKLLTIDTALLQDGGQVLSAGNVLEIRGSSLESDHLVINLSGINPGVWTPIPTGGVSFIAGEDGGGADSDSFEIKNYTASAGKVELTFTGHDSGNVNLQNFGTITFNETEPLTLSGRADDLVINLRDADDNDVVLGYGQTADDGRSLLTGSTFENVEFFKPNSSLTIQDLGGAKNIEVQGLDALHSFFFNEDFNADVSILDDASLNNEVRFTTNDIALVGSNVLISADTLSLGSNISTGDGAFEARVATATLAANVVVDTGTEDVTFEGTLDGPFDLAINSTGTTTFKAAVGGTTALGSLTTNTGGTTSLQNVTTRGDQKYGNLPRGP